MKNKNWTVLSKSKADIIKVLLKNRGFTNEKDFFDPLNPKNIKIKETGINVKEVKKARKRLEKARKMNEKVVIFGDYDVDGTTSTTIAWKVLHKLGISVFPYIPDRFTQGYGLTTISLKDLLEKHPDTSLLICVDNGITAKEAILEAKKNNIDTLVFDHHQKRGKSYAYATVHTEKLCAAGVVWFFFRKYMAEPNEFLDFVCLATVADQVKIEKINRSLLWYGLRALRNSKNFGILALAETSGILLKDIRTYEIGFVLCPRINAAGRMEHGMDVVRLFCTNDKFRAAKLSHHLNKLNKERQDVLNESVANALEIYKESSKRIIVLEGNFHEGVVGLIAGRLSEKTRKPALVFSKTEKGFKGSARSIPGFNITHAISQFSEYLETHGGHEMAAGLTVKLTCFTEFKKAIEEYGETTLSKIDAKKKILIDTKLSLKSVNLDFANKISLFEPFGPNNWEPLFLTENLEVIGAKPLGKDMKHIKILVRNGEEEREVVYFNMHPMTLSKGSKISLVYAININSWGGRQKVQLVGKDYIIHYGKSNRKKVPSLSG